MEHNYIHESEYIDEQLINVKVAKRIQYLTQSYDLTCHDIYIPYFPPLFSQKEEKSISNLSNFADEYISQRWSQLGLSGKRNLGGWLCHMIACLIVSLQKAGCKTIILDKLQLVTQGLDENPAQILARLWKPYKKYTRLDHFGRAPLSLTPIYLPVIP